MQHYLKRGRLVRVRRGLYAVVSPGIEPESMLIDPYLVAAKAAKDSILAYHTALDLYGFSYSTVQQLTFLTTQKIKPFTFQDQWFQPVAMPAPLLTQSAEEFEVETINRQGIEIRITSLARTFVDVLDRAELSGGWEEVCRAISSIAVLNIEQVIQYCLLLKNATLAAKVGYFLEQRSGAFAVSQETLLPLLAAKPASPQYLSNRYQKHCHLIPKWNLKIPESILNQTWEEPNYDV